MFAVISLHAQEFTHIRTIHIDTSLQAEVKSPAALTVQPSEFIYVLDRGIHRIIKFNMAGQALEFRGRFGWKPQEFDSPADLVLAQNLDLYVADYNNSRIQHFDREMNFIRTIPLEFSSLESTPYPKSLDQSAGGWLYVLDNEGAQILQLRPDGTLSKVFGSFTDLGTELEGGVKLRVDRADNVWVLAANPSRLYRFDRFGTLRDQFRYENYPDFISFTIAGREIILLSSTGMIYRMTSRGQLESVELIGPGLEGSPVELTAGGYQLYLLRETPLSISAYRIPSPQEK